MTVIATTASTAQSKARRRATLLPAADTQVAKSEVPTSNSTGTNHREPTSSTSSCSARPFRRRSSGWLRIRWAMGRRKRRTNSAVNTAAVALARVLRQSAVCSPSPATRRGSWAASPRAARLPISHNGRNAWRRRIFSARIRCGPLSIDRQITQSAENRVPQTST
ncbi:hypothetical protein D9M73_156230 [compost metagenome]